MLDNVKKVVNESATWLAQQYFKAQVQFYDYVGIGSVLPAQNGQTNATALLQVSAKGSGNVPAVILSTDQTADTTNVGPVMWAFTATAAADKRGAEIACIAVGSAATNVTAELHFYTATAGTLASRFAISPTGALRVAAITQLPTAANNAAAASAGVPVGGFYKTSADPAVVCIRTA